MPGIVNKCKVCGKPYLLRFTVGMSYLFPVCCEECLVKYIESLDPREIKPGTYNNGEFSIEEFYGKHFKTEYEEAVFNALSQYFPIIYEPFILTSGSKQYVPDFFLPEQGIFIEVKGGRVSRYRKVSYFSKYVPIYLITRGFGRLMKWI